MSMRLASAGVCLALAVTGLPACGVNIDREGHIERDQKRFPVEGAVDLHLYTFDGPVEVRSWSRPEIVVDVEKRGQDKEAVSRIELLAERDGNRIQIEARHPGSGGVFIGIGTFRSPSAKFIATVPRATNLVVRSGDGNVVIERVDGRIELRTSDGNIRAVQTTGELLAESGDGTITLEEVSGRVEARTDDGGLRIAGTPSMLRARTGDGAIVLRLRDGTTMREDWLATTRDGSISVEIPASFNADIEADPGSDGRARSDLRLVNVSGGTRDQRILRGRLGEGGFRFVLRTGDGNIRISQY